MLRVLPIKDSGMKEDLKLYGNELNYANAFWSAAYVIGQVPSNLLLTRVRLPSVPEHNVRLINLIGSGSILYRVPRARLDHLHLRDFGSQDCQSALRRSVLVSAALTASSAVLTPTI